MRDYNKIQFRGANNSNRTIPTNTVSTNKLGSNKSASNKTGSNTNTTPNRSVHNTPGKKIVSSAGSASKIPTPGSASKIPTPGSASKIPTPGSTSKTPTPGSASKIPTPGSASKIPTRKSSNLVMVEDEKKSPDTPPALQNPTPLSRSGGSGYSHTGSTSTATTAATTVEGRSLSPPHNTSSHHPYVSPSAIPEEDDDDEDDILSGSRVGDSRSQIQQENLLSSSLSGSAAAQLSTSDALAMRREGAEATIARLRQTIDELSARDASTKSALAKSDAVILELRSSVRQLKRQLDKVTGSNNNNGDNATLTSEEATMQNRAMAELQVELDKAHAQLLTADMVRKELEDTLEAEQYTWELRVQDQERTIQQLQHECTVLAEDLEQCRTQWKEAEDGWTAEVQELQTKVERLQKEMAMTKQQAKNNANTTSGAEDEAAALKQRIKVMESERNELQSCLDEALKELEAVDAELQGDGGAAQLRQENQRLQEELRQHDVVEPLQHLYRLLLERAGLDDSIHTVPRDARQLVGAVRAHLDQYGSSLSDDKDLAETKKQVIELESQLSVYRGDLKAREESSAELRASLKEAVSLLKPLQDAVAKAEREKTRMQEKIDRLQEQVKAGSTEHDDQIKKLKKIIEEKEDEIENLKSEIESLELQLSRAKLVAANHVLETQKLDTAEFLDAATKKREELRAKRNAETSLQQLLRETQTRFSSLQKHNEEVESRNRQLQNRLNGTEFQTTQSQESDANEAQAMKEAKIMELENECKILRGELAKKDVELRAIDKELQEAKNSRSPDSPQVADRRIRELQTRLAATTEELRIKKEVEKALNKSLREALGLLKPLQMHLEEAEAEKREMAKEMRTLRQRLGEPASQRAARATGSGSSIVDQDTIRDLEETVKYLELENSQLHDALEDMSQSLNHSQVSGMSNKKSESKQREEFVEMKSRYEVTKSRLDDAYMENRSLLDGLKKRDAESQAMVEELKVLRDKLKNSEAELENAKFIATSALVKVEELTMANVERLSLNSETLYKEKAKEVEKEMISARQQRSKLLYRLS